MGQLQLLTNTNFNVLGKKVLFLGISAVALVGSLAILVSRNLNYGIDFRGGTEVRVKFRDQPELGAIRKNLESLGLGDVNIQRLGRLVDRELLIRVGQRSGSGEEGGLVGAGDVSQSVLSALRSEADLQQEAEGKLDLNQVDAEALQSWLLARAEEARVQGQLAPEATIDASGVAEALVEARDGQGGLFVSMGNLDGAPAVTEEVKTLLEEGTYLGSISPRSLDFVGPTAGRELIRKARYAVLGSIVGILIYIGFRFRVLWGLAGVAALVHDVIIALGALALTQKEFTLPVVAAVLTIAGYSINDTVVVFDRIRENLRAHRAKDFEMVVNASLNQTFSRTVLTSFTALLAATALYLFGGDKLDALSFTLLVGFTSGTYSTIFVATPLLVLTHRWWGGRRKG